MPKIQHNPRETNEPHGVSLQASDVLQQTFAVKFRGYDRLDVDSYLEIVAQEMERLNSHTMTLIDDLRATQQELSLLQKQKDNINEALITVQKLTGEVQKKAQAEAERLMKETRDKAREIVTQSQTQIQAQKDEITRMRERAESEARNCVDAARQEAERITNEAQEQASKSHEEADSITSQAQDQARALIEDSRCQADAILDEARTKSTAAQEEADRIRAQAAQEAQTIIDKERAESEHMQEDLQRSHTKLQDELAVLTQQKNQFETSFRALIETHLKLMEGNGEQKSD